MLKISKAKGRYFVSILLGLLGCISFIMVTVNRDINNFLLEVIIAFTTGGLMSYGYETIKELYEKDVALKIRKLIITFGILMIIVVSIVNYFYSSFLASVTGTILSCILVFIIYKKY